MAAVAALEVEKVAAVPEAAAEQAALVGLAEPVERAALGEPEV